MIVGFVVAQRLPQCVPTENSVQPMADVIPSNRTANLEPFAALLESGEPNSPMHACATEHSSNRDFKAPRIGTAQPRLDSGSFRQPAVRSEMCFSTFCRGFLARRRGDSRRKRRGNVGEPR